MKRTLSTPIQRTVSWDETLSPIEPNAGQPPHVNDMVLSSSKKMKFGKSPGPSGTVAKMLKARVVEAPIPCPGVLCSKPLGSSKDDSTFHPFEVSQMSTRNFRELSSKKENASS